MVITIRVDFGMVLGIYCGLFVFGLAFNALTAWLEQHGYMEGFTSLMVAIGVALTLSPLAFISPTLFLGIVGGFVASGLPMIGGSISRYIKQRKESQKAIARLYGIDPPGMAE